MSVGRLEIIALMAGQRELMVEQGRILAEMQKGQSGMMEEIREELSEGRYRAQASDLLKDSKRDWSIQDQKEVDQLRELVREFRSVIDPLSAAATKLAVSPTALDRRISTSTLPEKEEEMVPSPTGAASAMENAGEGSKGALKKKLMRKSDSVKSRFMELLNHLEDGKIDGWDEYFPAGYRSRIAPEFISEIVGEGKSCEQYARDFLRDHACSKS